MSLMMNCYTGYSDLELIELAIQEDLKAVGIDTRLENQEFAVIFGTWEDGSPRLLGDFEILVIDAGGSLSRVKISCWSHHPDQVPSEETPGGTNISRWVRRTSANCVRGTNASVAKDPALCLAKHGALAPTLSSRPAVVAAPGT